ncbi:Adenylate cyclase, class 3 [Flavobacteriaceae bacterium MAR_2010_188]|nr:Adenylate cyclase, class 3 [Flavobacteriaceae bacterium MAR_2010_188]
MWRDLFSRILLISFISFLGLTANAQDQKIADSLKEIFENGKNDDALNILKHISRAETNPDSIIAYSDKLIEKAAEDSLASYHIFGYLQRGNGLKLKGNYPESLDSYFQAIKLAQRFEQNDEIPPLFISVADTYTNLKDYEAAENYYDDGILLFRKSNDSLHLASALSNSGEMQFFADNYSKALVRLEEAKKIFTLLDHQIGVAYSLGNIGMVYTRQHKYDLAKELLNDAIDILIKNEDLYPISVYERYLAEIYRSEGNIDQAFQHGRRSLKLATRYNLKDQISDANLMLFELHNKAGNLDSALFYHLNYIDIRDRIRNLEEIEKSGRIRRQFDLSQKQGELDISNEKRRTQKIVTIAALGIVFLIAMLTLGLYRRNNFIRKSNIILEREKNRSDHLLRNILPQETAKELKDFGKVKAKKFDSVSVLFADFKGFTLHAEHLSPEDLVKSIDYYFSKFDDIIDKYGIEKIKTLGDCYMCACGLPFPEENHAQKLILAAKEFLDFVRLAKIDNTDNTTRFDLRVGISSGPVVAGVVGKKKFAYDIWGDTVNIASRMEAASEVDKINISEDTYEQVKDDFNCTYRGEIHVKNKGMMKMYFVEGIECNLQDKDIESGLKVHTA